MIMMTIKIIFAMSGWKMFMPIKKTNATNRFSLMPVDSMKNAENLSAIQQATAKQEPVATPVEPIFYRIPVGGKFSLFVVALTNYIFLHNDNERMTMILWQRWVLKVIKIIVVMTTTKAATSTKSKNFKTLTMIMMRRMGTCSQAGTLRV